MIRSLTDYMYVKRGSIRRGSADLFGVSGADDEGFAGGFDDVDGDGVELVDAHEPGDLAREGP